MDYFVAPPVLFNSSELAFDFFAFARYKCLTKKLQEKAIESSSSYVRLFGFYAQQNMNSAANFVFTSNTAGLPRVVLVLRWVLFVPEMSFVSPLTLGV